MATMNTNALDFEIGRHTNGCVLVKTPHGDAYKSGSLYHCANCHCVLRQTYNYDYPAMMAAHAPGCSNPSQHPAPQTLAKAFANPLRVQELGAQPAVNEIAAKRVIAFEGDAACPTDAFYTMVDGVSREHRFAGDPQVEMRHVDRPIAVGDYVRWERGAHWPGNWVEGEVIAIDPGFTIDLRVTAFGPGRHDDRSTVNLGTEARHGIEVRRIQRPSTAQAEVRSATLDANLAQLNAHDHAMPAQRHLAVTGTISNPFYFAGVDHEKRDDRVDALMYAMKAMPRIDVDKVRREFARAAPVRTIGSPVPQVGVTPGPKLYDGLTARQCFERYTENQRETCSGKGSRWLLTEAQKRAASLVWTGKLIGKVAVSDEQRKDSEPSVLVQLEDD